MGLATLTADLPYNALIDIVLHPTKLGQPVTLTDLQWAPNHSAVLIDVSEDKTRCRVHIDPGVLPHEIVGQIVTVGVLGGGQIVNVNLTIKDPIAVNPTPTADTLGATISAPFLAS